MVTTSQPYDEASVLVQYLWHNYYALLSRPQRYADFVLQEAIKSKGNRDRSGHFYRRIPAEYRDEVDALVASTDLESFRRKVCEAIMQDQADKVVILRCPRCQRIVRTPKAQQCFWCGHDWHTSSAPLE